MILKKRAYECPQCGQSHTERRWDTDPPPACSACGTTMAETGAATVRAPGVVDDTVIGGKWCETIGQEPFFYTSKSELRREAERRGYRNVVRHTEDYHAKQRKEHDEYVRDTHSLTTQERRR